MAVDVAKLIAQSPYLYHVTYAASLDRIRRLRCLESAARLLEASGQSRWLRERRETMITFSAEGDTVVLTDQKPLVEANIAFQDGWALPDLIEAINRRVFFWRGPASGLLKKDQGHTGKYTAAGESLVFLRMRLEETRQANADRGPELCRYNSGAARKNNGQPIPRGPRTFVPPEETDFDVGTVREVVFRDFVLLPASTEYGEGSWGGPWHQLIRDDDAGPAASSAAD